MVSQGHDGFLRSRSVLRRIEHGGQGYPIALGLMFWHKIREQVNRFSVRLEC